MIVLSKVEEKMEERDRLLGQAEFNLEPNDGNYLNSPPVE